MKNEQEIKDEIDAQRKSMQEFRTSFIAGHISEELLNRSILERKQYIVALRWVLGEMDRYD